MRITVTQAKPVIPPVEKVTLELSPTEAVVLYRAIGRLSFEALVKNNRDEFTADAVLYAADVRRTGTHLYNEMQTHLLKAELISRSPA